MKQERPSFRVYRAHIYRQYFGRSLSAKPITGKHGERYAILKNTPYKLFWIIYFPLILIITFTQGMQFGFIPLLAGLVLYFIIAMIRYFFAGFVKIEDSEFISYEMCSNASKDMRPELSAYLKYIFVPARNRYKQLIKDADGHEYYPIPRKYYETSLFNGLFYSTTYVGLLMGIGFTISALLVIGALLLLMSPLSLYYVRFKSADDNDGALSQDDESSSVLYKIISGVFIAVGLAVSVGAIVILFLMLGSYNGEEVSFIQPSTIGQTYDSTLAYASEHLGKADLTDFWMRYDDLNAVQSGKPSSWNLTFQNAPDLLPRPNETMRFHDDRNNIVAHHNAYNIIRPTYNAELVTDPSEILAILRSENEALSDLNIRYITITPVDFSLFRIHDPEECLVDIEGEQEAMKYIVNIRDKTVRLVYSWSE